MKLALSRLCDEVYARVRMSDGAERNAVLTPTGVLIRGDDLSLVGFSPRELHFRIWNQTQPPSWSDTRSRAEFLKLFPE